MRALTLKPWWAHAVAHLGKTTENRKRPIPPALVGARVAIHAGARPPKSGAFRAGLRELQTHRPDFDFSFTHWPYENPIAWTTWPAWETVATRAIVATAVLAGEYRAQHADAPAWAEVGAHWWRLDDVRTLAEPIPWARGQLGLWNLPADVSAQLEVM